MDAIIDGLMIVALGSALIFPFVAGFWGYLENKEKRKQNSSKLGDWLMWITSWLYLAMMFGVVVSALLSLLKDLLRLFR